jgi:hypothetical protein
MTLLRIDIIYVGVFSLYQLFLCHMVKFWNTEQRKWTAGTCLYLPGLLLPILFSHLLRFCFVSCFMEKLAKYQPSGTLNYMKKRGWKLQAGVCSQIAFEGHVCKFLNCCQWRNHRINLNN